VTEKDLDSGEVTGCVWDRMNRIDRIDRMIFDRLFRDV
jgi:hypothetical protein